MWTLESWSASSAEDGDAGKVVGRRRLALDVDGRTICLDARKNTRFSDDVRTQASRGMRNDSPALLKHVTIVASVVGVDR